jgi:hypothetical protein
MSFTDSVQMTPGQLLARGAARMLRDLGFAPLDEFVPTRGLRVDLIAVGPRAEIWIVECKSSRADYASDAKWSNYLAWCDRYFWAVDAAFPTELLPAESGIILADAYDAEVLRMPEASPLAAARRKTLMQKVARTSMLRLQSLRDPDLERRGRIIDGA